MCLLVCGVVRLFVVLWIVCCCVVGRRLCVVGCVSFIVIALAVVQKTISVTVHKLHRKVFSPLRL